MYNNQLNKPIADVEFVLDKSAIESGMAVADLGSGSSGRYVFPAAKMVGKNGKVFAVDILKTNLETVRRRIKVDGVDNIFTIWSDIEIFNATKIESSSLDIVYLINTLYQSHKRAEMIREATRMLKVGGKVVVIEWKKIASPFGPPDEFKVKKENLIRICKKYSVILKEEFFAGKYHYGLIFNKI